MSTSLPLAPPGFHVMTKPIGPICNLDCRYCFYLEKERLYPGQAHWRMTDEVLETCIRQYIASQDVPEIAFAWQGGEPTLLGLDFFKRVVAFQEKHAGGKRITNALQTNGTLLDDQWCEFFREHKFLIGLSIDGPCEFHDRYRLDKKGRPTFDAVYAGMQLMKKHGVDFNALCVVNRHNSAAPLKVYDFLANEGSGFIQFIPIVERIESDGSLAEPPVLSGSGADDAKPSAAQIAPWSVEPQAYGEFLCAIFDHWVRRDVGRVFVQIFDVQLGIWLGMPSSLCVFGETCGNALALEHNGDLYSCDHYVYPRYHLGNIMRRDIREMLESPQQRRFGADKLDSLPKYCRDCDVRFACNGECPKHRFMTSANGEAGLNYLCAGYRKFLRHIDPYMTAMARLLQAQRPAADIMEMLAARENQQRQETTWSTAGRNDPCPCGSGKKFKKCCWEKRVATR